jgi:hypothetical protein
MRIAQPSVETLGPRSSGVESRRDIHAQLSEILVALGGTPALRGLVHRELAWLEHRAG